MKLLRRLAKSLFFLVILSCLTLVYLGLQGEAIAAESGVAQALISDPTGASVLRGQVTFTETSEGIQIAAMVENAPPGNHGFHIHEIGSCAEGGNAAGGHFNPAGVKHGLLRVDGFDAAHAGDLGNILIRSDGAGIMTQSLPGLRLSEGEYAIADRAVILHADRDDFGQPTGNAGGRIGCGEIQASAAP